MTTGMPPNISASSQLFFTSPIGLGHATRDVAIIEKLRSMHLVDKDFFLITGGGAARLFAKLGIPVGDLYQVPGFDVRSGELEHTFLWLMKYLSYFNKCKKIARVALNQNPRPIICDEDFAAIAAGEEFQRPRVLITDIYDIKFTSGIASLILENRMNSLMHKLMRGCDQVIFADEGEDEDNMMYVGPIVREIESDRAALRKKFGLTRKTIVVSSGGTDAGRFLINKTIEAYLKVKEKLDSELIIVSGPSLTLPDSTDCRNLGFIENLHELIYAADLVVSLAGRSTMDESIAYGTPGIFIPIRKHFEQEAGAKRLGYSFEDIFRLDTLIQEKIAENRKGTSTKGAEKAAKIISKLIN